MGVSNAHQIVRSALSLAQSLRMLVSERFRFWRMDRETVRALPVAMCVGVAVERHAHATTRWRDSGYGSRLFPYAWLDEGTQRNYDPAARANRGYKDDSEFWPSRTLAYNVFGSCRAPQTQAWIPLTPEARRPVGPGSGEETGAEGLNRRLASGFGRCGWEDATPGRSIAAMSRHRSANIVSLCTPQREEQL